MANIKHNTIQFKQFHLFCYTFCVLLLAVVCYRLKCVITKSAPEATNLFFGSVKYDAEKDSFSDLVKYLNTPDKESDHEPFEFVIIKFSDDIDNITIGQLLNETINEDTTVFEKFQLMVKKNELYSENDPLIPELLNKLATTAIDEIEQQDDGTQFKFLLYFEGGGMAIAKPMRYSRDEQDTPPNRMYFAEFERHTAEIATFHLDRILGFRRSAPVVGRVLNLTEIEELVPPDIQETFFMSPANNVCFYGNCTYYCDAEHAFCGKGDQIEAAIIAYLPLFALGRQVHWESPWRRTYLKRLKAPWEKDANFCTNTVKRNPIYADGRRLLDVMDMTILDFLTGNQDRHHYETFDVYDDDATILHLDHGRGFGRADFDDPSVLTPIRQCCLIRNSTLATLLRFHNGPTPLSELMRESLTSDPLAPILHDSHLLALDRRVAILLHTIRNCIKNIADEMKIN